MTRYAKKRLPLQFLFVVTVIIFVLLDTRLRLPAQHILRWVFPAVLFVLSALFSKHKAVGFPSSAYIVLVGYFALTILWSPVQLYSLERLISLLLIVGMYVSYYLYLSEKNLLDEVVRCLGMVFVLYGLVNFAFIGTTVSGRTIGVSGNANSVGLTANIALAFAAYFYEKAEKKKKKYWIVLMILFAIEAVMSGSRTAVILLALCFSNYFFFIRKHRFFAVVVPALILILSLLPSNVLGAVPILNRLNKLGLDRGELWRYAIGVFLQKPVFGWGYGASNTTTSVKVAEGMGYHSSYLTILVETGIIGLLLVFAFIIPVIVNGIKKWRQTGSAELRTMLVLAFIMLISFYGESSMTSVGSTEGFFFWGLIVWIILKTTKGGITTNVSYES